MRGPVSYGLCATVSLILWTSFCDSADQADVLGAVEDAWVAFLVPIDATELVLQAGDLADPALIPLTLPDLR